MARNFSNIQLSIRQKVVVGFTLFGAAWRRIGMLAYRDLLGSRDNGEFFFAGNRVDATVGDQQAYNCDTGESGCYVHVSVLLE